MLGGSSMFEMEDIKQLLKQYVQERGEWGCEMDAYLMSINGGVAKIERKLDSRRSKQRRKVKMY